MSLVSPEPVGWSDRHIEQTCQGALHPLAIRGIALFNARDYFGAHEALETAWREEPGAVRDVYRGILQVGLAYYHIQRLNYRGAVKMFQRCRQWLAPFPDTCRGIDLGQLRSDFLRAEEELLRLGPEKLAYFNHDLLKPLIFRIGEEPSDEL